MSAFTRSVSTLLLMLLVATSTFALEGGSGAEGSGSPDGAPASEAASAEARGSSSGSPAKASGGDTWKKDTSAWKVSLYPVLAWAPVFGTDVTLPSVSRPGQPDVSPSGSTSGSFNGAAFVGFEVQKSKWSATGNFLWAGLSGDRDTPKTHIGLDVLFGQVMAGREILPDLTLEGGVRRMALKITASVEDSPEVSRKPGVWDPLVGVTYRKQLSKSWRLQAHADGGGFGVGSDSDIAGMVRAEWRFARHFGLTMGFGALHFKVSSTVEQKTLTVQQTMYGPVFGFGIYF